MKTATRQHQETTMTETETETEFDDIENTTVRHAIGDSIREARTVHLTVRDLGSEYDPVVTVLAALADGHAYADEIEYWGTVNGISGLNGDAWRVHVERR